MTSPRSAAKAGWSCHSCPCQSSLSSSWSGRGFTGVQLLTDRRRQLISLVVVVLGAASWPAARPPGSAPTASAPGTPWLACSDGAAAADCGAVLTAARLLSFQSFFHSQEALRGPEHRSLKTGIQESVVTGVQQLGRGRLGSFRSPTGAFGPSSRVRRRRKWTDTSPRSHR